MKLLATAGRLLLVTLKRIYDILASYLLFWMVYVTAISVALHEGFRFLWEHLGVENADLVWAQMATRVGLEVDQTRLAVVILLHLLIFVVLRRPIAVVQPWFERRIDSLAGIFDRVTSDRFSLRLFGEATFTIVVTALLVPFVIQPTLVRGNSAEAWIERGVNLIDGSAVFETRDSVIAFYRQIGAEPVVVEEGVDSAAVDEAIAAADDPDLPEPEVGVVPKFDYPNMQRPDPPVGPEETTAGVPGAERSALRLEVVNAPMPIMDRWDDDILDAVDHDLELFSYVKAFMYVESAGRQYAVSRTGCAGLMQFCSGTAKTQPYRKVFGVGKVYACGCRGASCQVPRSVARALESGSKSAVVAQSDDFPCELSDARFDPPKALKAGRLYVERLHRSFGGNIYLMYVGYNSGPAVAKRVWKSVGRNPEASLEQIAEHLPAALEPYYGSSSDARARSLVRVHLPKIAKAQQRFSYATPGSEAVSMLQPSE